jgi:hypothetical protein
MKLSRASFDGSLLARGFWLYVWRITQGNRTALYVGRTGDSSSKYASSPFSRLGQHLDVRPNAKANTLLKNLRKAGFSPESASFELFSIGPLFPEQQTVESHRKYRDIVAPLEAALAGWLRNAGHEVLGTHPVARALDEALFGQVVSELKVVFP